MAEIVKDTKARIRRERLRVVLAVQRLVAQLPWHQNIALIERLENSDERPWDAKQVIRNGW